MDGEAIMYLVFCAVIPVLAIANISAFGGGIWSIIVVFLVVFNLAFLAAMTFADFFVFPLITGMLGITFQPFKDYKITKGQDAVIKNVNGLYYATGFVTSNLFAFVFKAEQAEEGVESKQVQAIDAWEKMIMSVKFAFKFHVLSVARDVQIVRDELEGKRSYQEFEMSKALQAKNSSEVIIGGIQRKINVIQAQIDSIGSGEKPMASLMYFETTAVGVSEKSAMDTLAAQVKQLQVAASGMNTQLTRIVGRELYILFRYSFILPTDFEELHSNFDVEQ
jgi:hypothetical protein